MDTTTRTLKGVTYSAYPSLRNTSGAPAGKKQNKTKQNPLKTQSTNYRGTRD
jgi:hypothetical protein